MTPGLGSRLTGKLLGQFGSPEGIFHASLTELEACGLPTEVRAELFPVKATTRTERASLLADALSPQEKNIFGLPGVDGAVQADVLVEKSELTSSEVLAALCEMEMKGIVRQRPGKQFVKVLL
jgi:hypothetical protein